jgi:Flp pilus assembly pilin Flp
MSGLITRISVGRQVAALRRFHRDQRGDALEYVVVLALFVIPLMALADKIRDILQDYFAMISFYVGWPFL